MRPRYLLTCLLIPAVALAGDAPTALVLEGDAVAGVGNVSTISNLAINDSGDVLVEVDTDNPDTDVDAAVLKNGALFLREGDALVLPVGATIDSFDTININAAGDSGWNFFLDGTAGFNDDSGIFLNADLLLQEGTLSTSLDFSPGTPYIGFFECKIDSAGDILVMASVDDPAIASSVDRALVLLDVAAGVVVSETVIAKEGDVLPGQAIGLDDFDTGPHNFDRNDAGDVAFAADIGADVAIYVNSTLIAQEGQASPVAGRDWSFLGSPELKLNNAGDFVYSGSLDGDASSNLLLVKNGAKLAQEGDAILDRNGNESNVTSFGSGPVLVADNGKCVWYADWDDTNTDVDTGLVVDGFVVVQEGVTQVGGLAIDTLRGIQDGYATNPAGTTLIFEAVLDDGTEGAFSLDLTPCLDLGLGLSGNSTPRLSSTGTFAGGTPISIDLTSGPPGGTTNLFVGLSSINAGFKGGILVPAPDFFFGGLPLDGAGAISLGGVWPNGVPANTRIFMQHWMPDAGGPKNLAASNAILITTP